MSFLWLQIKNDIYKNVRPLGLCMFMYFENTPGVFNITSIQMLCVLYIIIINKTNIYNIKDKKPNNQRCCDSEQTRAQRAVRGSRGTRVELRRGFAI